MLLEEYPQTLILTGPTGAGKSRLALELAERLDAEIVSMDSMALYRRMDIGTAKPTPDERHRVPHHLIDVLEPWESASVAWWLEQAAACCRDIAARGRRPLFVGGTPLYLKALLFGLFDGPPADEAIRQRLSTEAAATGTAALHARLAAVDPASAARLHPNDLRRVIRALEVWELTGRPLSDWQTQWRIVNRESYPFVNRESYPLVNRESYPLVNRESWIVDREDTISRSTTHDPRPTIHDPRSTIHDPRSTIHDPRFLCLDLPREELYTRIDARVEQMMAAGLAEEVQALRRLERPLSREAAQALGYKEMFDYLDGRVELGETIRQIQMRSRRFAKRQMTWFRALPMCRPVAPELTFAAWGSTMKR